MFRGWNEHRKGPMKRKLFGGDGKGNNMKDDGKSEKGGENKGHHEATGFTDNHRRRVLPHG